MGRAALLTDADIQAIRQRMKAIVARIRERADEIDAVVTTTDSEDGESSKETVLAVAPDDVLSALDNDENGRKVEEVK